MVLATLAAMLQATAITAPAVGSGVSVNLSTSDLLLILNALATAANISISVRRKKDGK